MNANEGYQEVLRLKKRVDEISGIKNPWA